MGESFGSLPHIFMENIREQVRDASIDEAIKENPNIVKSKEALVKSVCQKFFDKQVAMFPKYCAEAYKVNFQHNQELERYGIKGKFTDSYGWSKDRTMKAKWIVPQELRTFMINMVYWNFWDDSNAKVRDSFMKRVCQGGTLYDYDQLLKKVILHYGANYQDSGKKAVAG